MSDNEHDLAHEFPEFKDKIHELKISDAHFRGMFDKYHDLNKQIHRSESRIDLLSDEEEEKLKHERVQLKDQIYNLLKS